MLSRSGYRIISVTEGASVAALFWECRKPDNAILMAQLFRLRDDMISQILLVFDPRALAS